MPLTCLCLALLICFLANWSVGLIILSQLHLRGLVRAVRAVGKGDGLRRSRLLSRSSGASSGESNDEHGAKKMLLDLNAQICYHDRLYYSEDSPEISDGEFDALVKRATALEREWPSLAGTLEKLRIVGYKASDKFRTIPHSKKLLSLDNAFTSKDLDKFIRRCRKDLGLGTDEEGYSDSTTEPMSTAVRLDNIGATLVSEDDGLRFVLEPKFDGLSVSLVYKQGRLVTAATRGDGYVGEDVTPNVMNTSGIPQTLMTLVAGGRALLPMDVTIRGEVYMERGGFDDLNRRRVEEKQAPFANPRNAAAGSLRHLDANVSWSRPLCFVAYDIQGVDGGTGVSSHVEALQWLEAVGFTTPQPRFIFGSSGDNTRADMMHISELPRVLTQMVGERHTWAFDADGGVIKVDDWEQQCAIGEGTRFPHWAVAYKFPAEEGVSTVEDIIIQVGRTGALTPVAVLSPVTIGGVVVERATLHNQHELRRLGIRKGVRVRVLRAGDVIPKIIARVRGENEAEHSSVSDYGDGDDEESVFTIPHTCPVCDSPTAQDEGGAIVRCTGGLVCSAQAIERVLHFCSKDAADLKGIGPSVIEELFQAGWVQQPADLYRLRHMEEFSTDLEAQKHVDAQDKATVKFRRQQAEKEAGGTGIGGSADAAVPAVAVDAAGDDVESIEVKYVIGRKGWGLKSVRGLLDTIDDRRQLRYDRFLFGLGVRHVGIQTAKDIATSQSFPTFNDLWSYLRKEVELTVAKQGEQGSGSTVGDETGKEEKGSIGVDDIAPELQTINGLGPKAAASLVALYANEQSREAVENLLSEVEVIPMPISGTGSFGEEEGGMGRGPLAGRRVVFTGKLTSMSRPEAHKYCKALGGEALSSVTRVANLVVAAGGIDSTKAKKATNLGIEVWDEMQWLKVLDDVGS